MTAVAPEPIMSRPYPARRTGKGSMFLKMIRTTDPKDGRKATPSEMITQSVGRAAQPDDDLARADRHADG
ncbi:hypothetical protein ACVGOW_12685 [Pseudonocardia saturnea]